MPENRRSQVNQHHCMGNIISKHLMLWKKKKREGSLKTEYSKGRWANFQPEKGMSVGSGYPNP